MRKTGAPHPPLRAPSPGGRGNTSDARWPGQSASRKQNMTGKRRPAFVRSLIGCGLALASLVPAGRPRTRRRRGGALHPPGVLTAREAGHRHGTGVGEGRDHRHRRGDRQTDPVPGERRRSRRELLPAAGGPPLALQPDRRVAEVRQGEPRGQGPDPLLRPVLLHHGSGHGPGPPGQGPRRGLEGARVPAPHARPSRSVPARRRRSRSSSTARTAWPGSTTTPATPTSTSSARPRPTTE